MIHQISHTDSPDPIRTRGLIAVLLATTLLSACATYRPLPLNQIPTPLRLQDPPDDVIRERAENITHPILRPLVIDERDGMSPDEAAVMAVVANPVLVAIRDQRRLAAAQVIQAGILPNPQLSASLAVPAVGAPSGTVNAFGFGLGWDLKALLLRGALIEAAQQQAASIDLDVGWQEWQVAQAAKLQVYRIVFLKRQLVVARQSVGGFQTSVNVVQQALAAGYTTIVEMSSARAALLRAQALQLTVEQQLMLEKLALNRALGVQPARQVRLQDNIQPPDLSHLPDLTTIVQDLDSRRLDLLAFRLGYQSQEARLRAAVRGSFPNITLSFAQARDTGNISTVGPALSIGLPFFDRNQGSIAFMEATRQQLFDEYAARLFEARADVARILGNAQSLREQVQVGEQAIASLTSLVETYRVATQQGNADILVYYNARNELMTRQLDVIGLRQNLADLSVALEIASGRPLASMQLGGP